MKVSFYNLMIFYDFIIRIFFLAATLFKGLRAPCAGQPNPRTPAITWMVTMPDKIGQQTVSRQTVSRQTVSWQTVGSANCHRSANCRGQRWNTSISISSEVRANPEITGSNPARQRDSPSSPTSSMLWDLDGGSSVQIQDNERNKGRRKRTEKNKINKNVQKHSSYRF